MQKFQRYFETVTFLEGLASLPLQNDYMKKENNPDIYLKRMRYFLKLVGNPENSLKYVHITGTGGKGTVTNMIHETLLSAGKNVGSFTSPFVTTSIEKIRVGEKYISPTEFVEIVDHIRPYIEKCYLSGLYGRVSYFEIFLAIALLYFKKMKCEWIVLEVGLGGRYDATNIIKNPKITAITNIDYDHTEILGKTLKKIARDKAGIIKKGSLFFTTEKRKNILRIFQDACQKNNASYEAIKPGNTHTETNILLATKICRTLDIADAYIKKGISKAHLQARFEVIQQKPLVIIDGAHNRIKIKSTVDNLRQLKYRRLHIILAMSENKDYRPMLEQIVPLAAQIYVTRFNNKNRTCADPKELLKDVKRYMSKNSKTELFLDPLYALKTALKRANKKDVVLITGSFFLAGELRKIWHQEDKILTDRKSF